MLKELIKNYNGTKTYNRVLYNTFKDACFVRGLLNNNDEWYLTFQEAATWSSSFQLKQNFVTMLYYSIIYKWKDFLGGFPIANWWPLTRIETLISSYQTSYNKWSTNMLLDDLQYILCHNGIKITTFDLPNRSFDYNNCNNNCLIEVETSL